MAAGGDGTVNEVVQGLAGTSSCLGCLPTGTVNVWAREAGFSSDIRRAARQLVSGRVVRLDLGKIDGRYFLLMAGVGLDGEVTASLGSEVTKKRKLGILPYIVQAAKVFPTYSGSQIDIEIDGHEQRLDALMVLVSNTRLYGGVAHPTPEAAAYDGHLDVRIFRGRRPIDIAGHIIPFVFGLTSSRHRVVRATRVVIRADRPLKVQVDGDPSDQTPVEISVDHLALRAILGPNPDKSLSKPAA